MVAKLGKKVVETRKEQKIERRQQSTTDEEENGHRMIVRRFWWDRVSETDFEVMKRNVMRQPWALADVVTSEAEDGGRNHSRSITNGDQVPTPPPLRFDWNTRERGVTDLFIKHALNRVKYNYRWWWTFYLLARKFCSCKVINLLVLYITS